LEVSESASDGPKRVSGNSILTALSRLRESKVPERIYPRHGQTGRNRHQFAGPQFSGAAVVFAREGTASGHLPIYGKDRAQAHGQTNVHFSLQIALDNIVMPYFPQVSAGISGGFSEYEPVTVFAGPAGFCV
jgi:hypothetical protein